MITFAGIDGTSDEEETYQETFHDSFVNRLKRNELVQFTNPWYIRGPYTWGFDTRERAKLAMEHVVGAWNTGEARAVFLGGYSRGGAAVIEVAQMLRERSIPVECLILFDAVDRTHTLGGWVWNTPIASNVKRVIYPQRNVLLTQSRLTFGNCGFTRESDSTVFLHQKFFATHGGLGGTPWNKAVDPYTGLPILTIWEFGEPKATLVTPAKDHEGSDQVWAWARSHIAFAYAQCMERLRSEDPSKPAPPPSGPGAPQRPGPGNGKRIHVVKAGDWLSKIAQTYYGDMNKWHVIYDLPANKEKIGPDPNLIQPGQELIIP